MNRWTRLYAILSLSAVLTGCAHRPQLSYCTLYTPIIQQKGDGTITATPGVKRRVLANEKLHRQICEVK